MARAETGLWLARRWEPDEDILLDWLVAVGEAKRLISLLMADLISDLLSIDLVLVGPLLLSVVLVVISRLDVERDTVVRAMMRSFGFIMVLSS